MKKDKDKRIQKPGKKETSIVRSSAAEYLTFVAASGKGGVEAVCADENIWLTQKMMGVLYDVETHTINYHLKKVFADSELEEDSVIRNFRITAADGKNYNTKHYNFSAKEPVTAKYVAGVETYFKCKNEIPVFWWDGIPFCQEEPPDPKPKTIKLKYSKKYGGSYWANTCANCGMTQGDNFLFLFENGPLFGLPVSKRKAYNT
ncbi:hypothetical protein [Desulfobacula sp.]